MVSMEKADMARLSGGLAELFDARADVARA
jgi:hypothetical protein